MTHPPEFTFRMIALSLGEKSRPTFSAVMVLTIYLTIFGRDHAPRRPVPRDPKKKSPSATWSLDTKTSTVHCTKWGAVIAPHTGSGHFAIGALSGSGHFAIGALSGSGQKYRTGQEMSGSRQKKQLAFLQFVRIGTKMTLPFYFCPDPDFAPDCN